MPTSADLSAAIRQNDTQRVRELLEQDPTLANARTSLGATSFDASSSAPALSALMFAAYYGRTEIIQLLLAHDAQVDIFEAAAIGAWERAAGWLALHPELVNAFAPDGFTPLGLASFFGHTQVANLLLEHGADPNIHSLNAMRVAPLHSAVAGRHYDIASLLIAHGADVNAIQADGFTPLMGAAQNGDLAMVQLLLDHGADVNARVDARAQQFANMTALDLAESARAYPVVERLKTHGATS